MAIARPTCLPQLMRRYRGSHEDFDMFIVPAVPAGKQLRDTMAKLAELSRLGVPADKVRVIFNMIEDGTDIERAFLSRRLPPTMAGRIHERAPLGETWR